MEILFVLVPVSVIIMLIALAAFLWSVNNDQYEDLEMEAERILFDDHHQSHLQHQEQRQQETNKGIHMNQEKQS